MAVIQLAQTAGRVAAQYGPKALDAARNMLAKATNGKVSSVEQIPAYVGKSQQRLSVVADSLIRAGIPADAIFPVDIVQSNEALAQMRSSAMALGESLKAQFDRGADKVVPGQTAADAAADVIRVRRVRAALSVYGSEETYFLCHPNGGIPASDFAYVRALRRAL